MAEQLKFHRSLYLAEAVEAAAAAYAGHAKIETTRTPEGVDAVIDEAGEYDLTALAHAFANHVLHETIALRRQAAIDEGV